MIRHAGLKLYLIPLVAIALLLMPLLFVPGNWGPSTPIQIDGKFADWNAVPRVASGPTGANPNVDITHVAVADNVDDLAFLIEVQGQALQGDLSSNRVTDAFFVFIDTDRSRATGYQIEGLGADRLIEIDGWGGVVVSATMSEFDANVNAHDWMGWIKPTSVLAAGSGSQIEFEANWDAIANPKVPIDATFASRSWDESHDIASATATSATSFVVVRQQTSAPQVVSGSQDTATFTFQAVGRDSEIKALNVSLDGTFGPNTFSSIVLTDAGGTTLSLAPAARQARFTSLSIPIAAGTSTTLHLRLTIATNDGTTVGAFLASPSDVVVRPGGVSLVGPRHGAESLAYVGGIPSVPRVDGGFAEWTNATADPIGDVTPPATSDLDISRYAFAGSGGNVSFMVQTVGTVLNGTLVPQANKAYSANASAAPDTDRDGVPDSVDPFPYDFNNDGIPDVQTNCDVDGDGITDYGCPGGTDYWLNTTIPKTFPAPYAGRTVSVYIGPVQRPVDLGEDIARCYLDRDGSSATGYSIGGIGADYLVEIRGKEGLILSSTAMRFNGTGPGNWSWAPLGAAPSADDGSRLETDLPGVTLMNLSRAFIQTRGWQDGGDDGGALRPAFAVFGLMYSTAGGVDPTGIIDTASSSAVNGPAERNVFYDGTNFWAFYYDGSTIQYEPSSDGLSWVNTKNTAFTTAGIQKVSTWFYNGGGTKIVYIAGAVGSGTDLSVRRGTISGTTITWGTEAQVPSFSGQTWSMIPVITRDASGYVWVASNVKISGNAWNFDAARSTNVDDVSAWNAKTPLISGNSNNGGIQGVIVPLASGNVYAIWYDGAGVGIVGKLYSGSWGSLDSIAGCCGLLDRGPSATVDSSFNIHLIYTDPTGGGTVKYQERTSSWQSATTLDSSTGNKYPTISRDTGTGDLYAFWISSTYQIKGQKFSGGSWASLTIETNTKTKTSLTALYNVSSSSNVAWAWSQSSPSFSLDVKFSVLSTNLVSRTIDTSTDGTPGGGGYSHQRKVFYDGTRWWAFYYDGSSSVYTWSDNALTWENAVTQVFTTSGTNNPSVWFDSAGNIVYAVGDDGASDATVPVRRGTISGTTITWGTQATVTVSTVSFAFKATFITKDSNGFLWIASNSQPSTGNYDVAVVKSTNADDVSSWGTLTTLLSASIANSNVYPTILPLSSGNVYAFWYANGAIDGKIGTGTWGSLENIATTTSGIYTKVPSGTVDASGNIDLVYSDSNGAIIHKQRTGSGWGAADTVDSTTGNTQPTITWDSSNGSLYVFYVQSTNQIKGRKYSGGSWTDVMGIDSSTITKAGLTSPYSVSGGLIGFLWNQGNTTPYEIKIAVYVPEFGIVEIPLAGTLVLLLVLRARWRRSPGSHSSEREDRESANGAKLSWIRHATLRELSRGNLG